MCLSTRRYPDMQRQSLRLIGARSPGKKSPGDLGTPCAHFSMSSDSDEEPKLRHLPGVRNNGHVNTCPELLCLDRHKHLSCTTRARQHPCPRTEKSGQPWVRALQITGTSSSMICGTTPQSAQQQYAQAVSPFRFPI